MYAASLFWMFSQVLGFAETPLEQYLPEDTWLSVSVKSLSGLTEDYRASELPGLIEEDKLGSLLAPLKATPYWSHFSNLTTGGEPLTWDLFIEKYPGRVVIAFQGGAQTFHTNSEFHFLTIADYVGDVDFIIDLSTHEPSDHNDIEIKIIEEDYFGTTLYLEEIVYDEHARIDSGWTVVNNLYLEASPVSLLKETVDLVMEDTHNESLADNPLYNEAQLEWGDSEACVFVNLAAIIPVFKSSLRAEDMNLPPNPLGVSMRSLLDALALDNFNSVYAGLKNDSEGLRLYYGLLHRGLEGMLSLLSYTEGDISKSSFVPSDAVSASVSNFSITQAWRQFETMMSTMSPNFESYYKMQLNQLKMNTDIDIRESIIENFGDQFVMVTLPGDPPAAAKRDSEPTRINQFNQCYVFEIRDTHSFEMALEGFKDLISGNNRVFESRNFMGTTIHSPIVRYVSGMQVPTYSYAIHNGYLLFATGSKSALEPIIIHMEQGGEHLLELHDIQDTLTQLPANPNEVQYNDIGQLCKTMIRNLNVVAGRMGDFFPLLKLGQASQNIELPYFYLGGTYQDENRLSFEALIKKKSDADD